MFQRVELLIGKDALKKVSQSKVIIFGVGGVGGWCAESLIRSGVKDLTIVDYDVVAESNINRQLPADHETLSRFKVDVLRERFGKINPEAKLTTLNKHYTEETSPDFNLDNYDYIIDAIDSLKDKAHLICTACNTSAKLYSSMGAALKMDPTKIRIAEFWKVQGDPLARALRQRFRKTGDFPSRKFQCVYSEERLSNQVDHPANGTLMHITASFGLMLASLVLRDIVESLP